MDTRQLNETPETDALKLLAQASSSHWQTIQSLLLAHGEKETRLRAAELKLQEVERLIKNLAPTGRYEGLNIEEWYLRSLNAHANGFAAGADSMREPLAAAELRAKLIRAQTVERDIGIVRKYLSFDSQRAVSWHEVNDAIEVMQLSPADPDVQKRTDFPPAASGRRF